MDIARSENCHILSADSRQIYRDLPITTAAPSLEDRAAVPHHFVGTLNLDQYYSAALFEQQSLQLLDELFKEHPVQVMCGGSMMYIDAVMRGIDQLPTISDEIRQHCMQLYQNEGLEAVMHQLRRLDPEYAEIVDPANHRRVVHALEICLQAGVPYSTLRTGSIAQRPFDIKAYYIDMPREQLFDRINNRVLTMISDGMVDEITSVAHLRDLNSMNTVGVKEMLHVIDGDWSLDFATARLQKNTRVYAKKQLTWLKTRPQFTPLHP